MKYLIVALILSTFAFPSFAKVYNCWAALNGDPTYDTGSVKFSFDATTENHNAVTLSTKTGSGRSVTSKFWIMSTHNGEKAKMFIDTGKTETIDFENSRISGDVKDVVGEESHLNMVNHVKGGYGYDLVAKMGCTLIQK